MEELVGADGYTLSIRLVGTLQSAVRTWDDPDVLNVRMYVTLLRDDDRDNIHALYAFSGDRTCDVR